MIALGVCIVDADRDFTGAENLFRASIQIHNEVGGGSGYHLAATMSNLMYLLRSQKRYNEDLKLGEIAFGRDRAALGDEAPETKLCVELRSCLEEYGFPYNTEMSRSIPWKLAGVNCNSSKMWTLDDFGRTSIWNDREN
jgi:hypothetical protein